MGKLVRGKKSKTTSQTASVAKLAWIDGCRSTIDQLLNTVFGTKS